MAALVESSANTSVADLTVVKGTATRSNIPMDDTAAELGIWMSGLESFAAARHSFDSRGGSHVDDASREFELTHAVLERCLVLCTRLQAADEAALREISAAEISEMAHALRELARIGQCMRRAKPITTSEWAAWVDVMGLRLRQLAAARKCERQAERAGEEYLPEPLLSFSRRTDEMSNEQAELALVLPRFGKVLKWLSVLGKMLQSDEPLKPALLVLARVNELAQELVGYLNNRLERFPDKSGEIFASLDGASYLASIELRKVYSRELAGLIRVRPSPAVYSGMETAYSVLNESFQQILASMARIVDPTVDTSKLFPSFSLNIQRSLTLRRELWNLVRLTQAAEESPDKRRIEALNTALSEFMGGALNYLFYKDTDTVERFVEEITVAKRERDLVPILHRFGAYLETLFGQVNMRAVLEKHPFQPPE